MLTVERDGHFRAIGICFSPEDTIVVERIQPTDTSVPELPRVGQEHAVLSSKVRVG